VICTHETTSVSLWRCQRCSLQWPTLDMEPIPEDAAAMADATARVRDQKT
jgi:ribosomal protein L37AE/L43A